jgi:hypothetical protein
MTVRECDQLPPAAARREEEEEGDGAGDQVGRNADAPQDEKGEAAKVSLGC